MKMIYLYSIMLICGCCPQKYKDLPKNEYFYPFYANGIYGYLDQNGNTIIKPKYSYADFFSECLAGVKSQDKWGYINTNGAMVIYPQFDGVGQFHDDLAIVRSNGLYGYINKTGKYIILPQYFRVSIFSESLAAVAYREGKVGYINTNNLYVIRPIFSQAKPFREGYARIEIDNKWGFIDKFGNIKISTQFQWVSDYSQGLAVAKKFGEGCYFINKEGITVITQEFTEASCFSEKLAAVTIKGKTGFIARDGKIIIAPIYYRATDFVNGFSSVQLKSDGKWGFINSQGHLIIKLRFQQSSVFRNELALVEEGLYTGYINTNGNYIWKSRSINP